MSIMFAHILNISLFPVHRLFLYSSNVCMERAFLILVIWEKEVENSLSNIKPYQRRWEEKGRKWHPAVNLEPRRVQVIIFSQIGKDNHLAISWNLYFFHGSLPTNCRPLTWPQSPLLTSESMSCLCQQDPVLQTSSLSLYLWLPLWNPFFQSFSLCGVGRDSNMSPWLQSGARQVNQCRWENI